MVLNPRPLIQVPTPQSQALIVSFLPQLGFSLSDTVFACNVTSSNDFHNYRVGHGCATVNPLRFHFGVWGPAIIGVSTCKGCGKNVVALY